MDWASILSDAIAHASEVEAAGSALSRLPKIGVVAQATLIRQRRVAGAVLALGVEFGYEARVLVRTMLELHYNLAWLRLKRPNQRANRFVRFRCVEVLTMLKDAVPALDATRMKQTVRRLQEQRRNSARILRKTDRHGKRYWVKDWSDGASFEQRMLEVLKVGKATADPADRFMYAMYRWFSGAAHGSPDSMEAVALRAGIALIAKPDAELASAKALQVAAALLGSTSLLAATCMKLPREVRQAAKARTHAAHAAVMSTPPAA